MTESNRREFFRNCFATVAGLAVCGAGPLARQAEAARENGISGICLYVPSLGKAAEFVELMNDSAPGQWQVEALEGSFDQRYFAVRDLYRRACGHANTLVGVVDPASFTVIQEAITGSGGSFHYVTYEERGRVTFSVRLKNS